MSRKPKSRSYMPQIVGVLLVLGFALVVWWLRSYLAGAPPQTKKVAQDIQVIRPPPPPPNTPPPPPPPPKEDVDVPDPQQQPDPTPSNDPPPGDQLGVDADGTGAGDGFGLVGRKGGRDLLAAGSGSAFSWYAGLIKTEILDRLGDEQKVRTGSYSVMVRIWVRTDGTVERTKLMSSTGNSERDHAIETALGRMTRLSQAPPPNMPQPISLRIVSRG
jgi:protein TonB